MRNDEWNILWKMENGKSSFSGKSSLSPALRNSVHQPLGLFARGRLGNLAQLHPQF
jgi:hypothetical protein